jgi:hypothetical protein
MMFETAEHGAATGVVSKGGIPSQQIIQTCTQTGAFAVTPMIIGSALRCTSQPNVAMLSRYV